MRWVKTEPAVPATIYELFQQQPIKTKLYSSNGMDYLRSVVAALVPEILPEFVLEATADSGPLMQLLRKVAAIHSSFLFWLAWLLCPGLQTAYYMFFFASASPLKCAYATLIGLARTAVEVSAMLKCLQALLKGDKAAVVNSMLLVLHTRVSMINQTSITSNTTTTPECHGAAGLTQCTGRLPSCIMQEPAVTITGATYERTAILEWLKGQRRDPLTSRELRPEQISPNLALYRAIDEWLQGCRAGENVYDADNGQLGP
eukprot:gene3386-3659_t